MSELNADVKTILMEFPDARDCDLNLSLYYYQKFCGINPSNLSLLDFMKRVKNGKLHSLSTIERARRKVQEQHVELRGTKYEQRQRQSNEIRKNIVHE